MLGIGNKEVFLVEHSNEWGQFFLTEKKRLEKLLKTYYIDIQHVGSTSIPQIVAKPIVDIAIGVKNWKSAQTIKERMIKSGYIYCENAGDSDRIFLTKGNENNRICNIHVELYDGISWKNHILFRDWLLMNPEDARQYNDLKLKLAEKYCKDRLSYTKSKDVFIRKILDKCNRAEEENDPNLR